MTYRIISHRLNRSDFPVAKKVTEKIEPVNREIIKNQIVYLVERSAESPTLIPMHPEVQAQQVSQKTGFDSLAEIAKVRSPTPVLVYGEFQPFVVCKFDETFAFIQIQHKRFLAQNMFAGVERLFQKRKSFSWMCCDIDDLDVVSYKNFTIVCCDNGVRKKLSPSLYGAFFDEVTERDDVETRFL